MAVDEPSYCYLGVFMTKATIYLASAGLASLMFASAASADADTYGNASENRFDGFYAGAEAGATFATSGIYDWDAGFQYSGIVGYRWQQPSNWVFGLEGTFGNPEGPNPEISFFDPKYSYDWSAVAAAGYAFGNKGLLFAKVGWSGVRISTPLYQAVPNGSGGTTFEPTGERAHGSADGLRLGVGYEHAMTDSISLRLSADYSNFDAAPSMVKTSLGVIFKF